MGKKRFRMMWVILSVIVLSALVGVVFVNMPQFGRLPRGELGPLPGWRIS